MKIAYYLPSLQAPGGIERIVTFKANYFAEHFEGYDITIITSEQMGKAPHFPLSPKVKHIDLGVSFDLPYSQSIVSKVLKYPFRYYRFKQQLSNLLNELKPDITISTMRRELNFITKLKDGSLKIGEFHVSRYAYGAEALKRKSPIVNMIKKRWANRFVKNLSKLSRVIILTSEGAKDWPELTNISIIPNPISTPVEGKQTDILSHNAIAVGRYAPQKGFDMLIPAWSIVAQRHPDWKLHISSRYEGLPLVLGEAMAYGVAPVAFACPCGPRDMITHGKNGILVENGNIEQLAEQICYLIENENIRIEMGRQAKIRAKDFTMEAISQQWKSLFEELMEYAPK